MRQRQSKWMFGVLMLACIGLISGCATDDPTETKIVVPSAATSAPEYQGDGSLPDDSYVIRMSNGEQTWEVEFPSTASGYEMHIPLSEKRARGPADQLQWSSENLTEADRELLEQMRRENPQMRDEGVFVGGESASDPSGQQKKGDQGEDAATSDNKQEGESDAKPKAQKRPSQQGEQSGQKASKYKPSYLLGIQEVRNLYRRGNYELAMVRLKKLEEAYPGDVKLLTMKGTLWMNLDRPSLARKAWEQVLQIDPDNRQVIEALQRLNRRQGAGSAPNQGDDG